MGSVDGQAASSEEAEASLDAAVSWLEAASSLDAASSPDASLEAASLLAAWLDAALTPPTVALPVI